MKKHIFLVSFLILAIGIRIAMAVSSLTGTQTPLVGINSNTGGYTGASTFTVVDQYNVPANLSFGSLTVTSLNTSGATNLGPGATNYIQNSNTLQTGATAFPQFLTVGSSPTFYGGLTINTTSYTGAGGLSLTQINALTPPTTGFLVFCNNCTVDLLCISSGTSTGSFVAVSSGSAFGACK